MKRLLDKIGELWCRNVHQSAMWPVHGKYRCAVCLREYAVVFEAAHHAAVERANNVFPIQAASEARNSVRRRQPDSGRSRETATHAPNSIPA